MKSKSLIAHLALALALGPCLAATNGCRIAADGPGALLGSIGGAPDAVLFSGYHTKLFPDGSLVVHDPIGARLMLFRRDARGRLDCLRPSERIVVTGPPVSAIAVHDGAIYGMDLMGQLRLLYPTEKTGTRGEALNAPAPAPDKQQPLLSELARSHPLFQNRGVWPGADAASTGNQRTGEIGLSPTDNRLTSVPNGVALIGGQEYRHAFEWSSPNQGKLKLWQKDASATGIALPVAVPGILGAVDIVSAKPSGFTVSVESVDLDTTGAVRVIDHVLTYTADGKLQQRKLVAVPLATTRGNWTPMDAPPEGDPLSADRLFYFYRDNTALVTVSIDLTKVPPSSTKSTARVPAFAPIDSRREVLIQRADTILNVAWKTTQRSLNEGNANWSCVAPYVGDSQRWAQPIFLRDVRPGSQIYGMPYLWGGKAGVANFVSRIQAGSIAGNVCTRVVKGRTVEVPNSAGIDCSGFVSRVWELGDGKKRVDLSTAAISTDEYSRRLTTLQKLQPGDVLNKAGSHVRLFAGWVRTPFGLRIRSYESTVDSICSGTCMRDLRARAYIGYKPRGYPG